MIVLNTNVLSELLRAASEPVAVRWAANQSLNTLFMTTVSQAEMLYGVKRLPSSWRRP
ncbi:MAG: PIN domain-containing protein [Acidiferrobacter sp.]